MKRFTSVLLAVAFALLPAGVAAQLAPVPNPVEYLDYLYGSGVNGNNGSPSQVGPYTGQFLTGPAGSPTSGTFSIYCVDYAHTAESQWVNATSLGSGASDATMGLTRLGASSGSLAKYTKAAYISSLFNSWATFGSDKQTVWSAMHTAIWTIVSGTTVGNAGFTLRDFFIANAAAEYAANFAVSGFQPGSWYVLSPKDPADGQEFLVQVVPEPSTYILLATGLLFLVAFGRKRISSLKDDSYLA